MFKKIIDLQKVKLLKQAEALIPRLKDAKNSDVSDEVFKELTDKTIGIKKLIDSLKPKDKGYCRKI